MYSNMHKIVDQSKNEKNRVILFQNIQYKLGMGEFTLSLPNSRSSATFWFYILIVKEQNLVVVTSYEEDHYWFGFLVLILLLFLSFILFLLFNSNSLAAFPINLNKAPPHTQKSRLCHTKIIIGVYFPCITVDLV